MSEDNSEASEYECHCKNNSRFTTLWRSYVTQGSSFKKFREFQLMLHKDRDLHLAYTEQNLIKVKYQNITGWHGLGHYYANGGDKVSLHESDSHLTVYINGQPAVPVNPPSIEEDADDAVTSP